MGFVLDCDGPGSGSIGQGNPFSRTFIGGVNEFLVTSSSITDGCYGGRFLPYVPDVRVEREIFGKDEYPLVDRFSVDFPGIPDVDVHLIWDFEEGEIRGDPEHEPIVVSIDVGAFASFFKCVVTLHAEGVLTPTSETEVDAFVTVSHVDLEPYGLFPCDAFDPVDPNCVVTGFVHGREIDSSR